MSTCVDICCQRQLVNTGFGRNALNPCWEPLTALLRGQHGDTVRVFASELTGAVDGTEQPWYQNREIQYQGCSHQRVQVVARAFFSVTRTKR